MSQTHLSKDFAGPKRTHLGRKLVEMATNMMNIGGLELCLELGNAGKTNISWFCGLPLPLEKIDSKFFAKREIDGS